MSDKIALKGFSELRLFPVVDNTSEKYEVGEGFLVPWVQEMTQEPDTSESKIYADDGIYLNNKSWNGLNATITVAQMPLELWAKLGFGTLDEVTGVFDWNPQGKNLQFAASLRMLRADGNYRMMRLFSFTVNEVKPASIKTKGEGGDISAYQIVGVFTNRKRDDLPGKIKDTKTAADLSWLTEMNED